MKAIKFLIATMLLFQSISLLGQIENNAAQAFRIAGETQKNVLLVFAGSDWCAPCINFEKQVLMENNFMEFASKNLVVLKADFPQRKKLPMAEQEQNEALAEKYNPNGIFPQIVLLRVDQSVLSTLPYNRQTSFEFISQIRELLSQ